MAWVTPRSTRATCSSCTKAWNMTSKVFCVDWWICSTNATMLHSVAAIFECVVTPSNYSRLMSPPSHASRCSATPSIASAWSTQLRAKPSAARLRFWSSLPPTTWPARNECVQPCCASRPSWPRVWSGSTPTANCSRPSVLVCARAMTWR